MKILTQDVSRDFQDAQAIARAQIALHHFSRFTGGTPPLKRLLAGLAKRKLIARRPA
jgi:hypothetical protein